MQAVDTTQIIIVGNTNLADKLSYLKDKFRKLSLKYGGGGKLKEEPPRGYKVKCPHCSNTPLRQDIEDCQRCCGCGVLRWEHVNTAWGRYKQFVADCYDAEEAEMVFSSNLALMAGYGWWFGG